NTPRQATGHACLFLSLMRPKGRGIDPAAVAKCPCKHVHLARGFARIKQPAGAFPPNTQEYNPKISIAETRPPEADFQRNFAQAVQKFRIVHKCFFAKIPLKMNFQLMIFKEASDILSTRRGILYLYARRFNFYQGG
ncbi:MAG: hypothetical protein VZQ80_11050, partial [Lachnospiraceae bacterium]|nr:hypothetical protein [Lachnospiraceae bacterium]